jgi:hypothetical protein
MGAAFDMFVAIDLATCFNSIAIDSLRIRASLGIDRIGGLLEHHVLVLPLMARPRGEKGGGRISATARLAGLKRRPFLAPLCSALAPCSAASATPAAAHGGI